jgi:uncharacterized protein YjbJ (UPF0337 family)
MGNNSINLSAPWPQVKEKIKESNVELTDEDLDYSPGREEELLSRLAKKMNRTPEEVRAWIESVSANKGKAS